MISVPTESARSRPLRPRRILGPSHIARFSSTSLSRSAVTRAQGAAGRRARSPWTSTPSFMRRPNTRASSARRTGVNRVRSSMARCPLPTCSVHPSRSATFEARHPACWEAADGPAPPTPPSARCPRCAGTHAPAAQIETSYCAYPAHPAGPMCARTFAPRCPDQPYPALGQLHPEGRVLLECEAVGRDVVWPKGQRLVDVRVPLGGGLPWEGEHQVDIDARETRAPDALVGPVDLLPRVGATERIQERGPEALDTKGDPRNARCAQDREPLLCDRCGRQLHRPFGRARPPGSPWTISATRPRSAGDRSPGVPPPQNTVDRGRFQSTRRASRRQAIDETLHRFGGRTDLVKRTEVAGTGAEGHVDIEAERPRVLTFGLLPYGDSPH